MMKTHWPSIVLAIVVGAGIWVFFAGIGDAERARVAAPLVERSDVSTEKELRDKVVCAVFWIDGTVPCAICAFGAAFQMECNLPERPSGH